MNNFKWVSLTISKTTPYNECNYFSHPRFEKMLFWL